MGPVKKLDRVIELNDRAVRSLVEAHAMKMTEPLILAVRYRLDEPDIHLLEVLDGFPGEAGDEPFQTEFGSSHEIFILGKLHLVLVNPAQLRTLIERDDKLIQAVRRDGRLEYQSIDAASLAELLGVRPGVSTSQHQARLRLLQDLGDENRATPEEMDEIQRKWQE